MTSKAKILVIDDEPEIRRLLKVALTGHGYIFSEAASGKEGLLEATVFRPDLIILDMGLPDIDGLEVIHRLREWTEVPIIILSVREQESDKIPALDEGADDYITKPFSMGELLARIRVALRHHTNTQVEPLLEFEGLTVDLSRRLVLVNDQEVKLTPIEYDLLKELVINEGKVLTHKQLLKKVWGKEYQNENHYLRVYVGQLRKKIEPEPAQPRFIITEPGVGYRMTLTRKQKLTDQEA